MNTVPMPKTYMKKPIPIHAMEIPLSNEDGTEFAWGSISAWLLMNGCEFQMAEDAKGIHVETEEGVMLGNNGDFIIRGVHNEFYPIKRETFLDTYEEVLT